MDKRDWNFPFEEPLHEVFPALHDAQSTLSRVDARERLWQEYLAVYEGVRT